MPDAATVRLMGWRVLVDRCPMPDAGHGTRDAVTVRLLVLSAMRNRRRATDKPPAGRRSAAVLWDRDGRRLMPDAVTVRLMVLCCGCCEIDAGRLAMPNRRRATDKPPAGRPSAAVL